MKTVNRYIGPVSDVRPDFYHGTLEPFDAFDISKAGKNTQCPNASWGLFFIPDKSRAARFVEDTRSPGDHRPARVLRVALDIKKPLDLTLLGILTKPEQAAVIYEAYTGECVSPDEALEFLDGALDLGTVADFYDELYSNPDAKQLFESAGYDGIISEFGRDDGEVVKEYVAFRPDQVTILGDESDPSH